MAPMDQIWSEDSTIGVHNKNIKTDKISGRVWPPGAPESPAGLIYPMGPMDQDSTIGVHNKNIKTYKISGRVWSPGAREPPKRPPGGVI